MTTKKNILREHLATWLAARGDKKKRGELLKHICFVTGISPKSVPRSFRRVQLHDPGVGEHRGRKTYYTPDVILALRDVSEVANHPCGENLHALIGEYVRVMIRDKHWRHDPEVTRKLLEMSEGTVKVYAGRFVHLRQMIRGKSLTKAGSIRSAIPIRMGPWERAGVGTLQVDTVAHCGDTVSGDFVYTVNATDVPTLWGERRSQWQKGQEATVRSMTIINDRVPFPVIEWHPDSGSEFVNWHSKAWCEARGQKLTRSRPNHKNDNCYVEERNGHVVRKYVGYTRLDVREVVLILNQCYDVLTPYLNHFIPSRRIIKKERVGARWKITREKKSLTPYARMLLRADVSLEIKHRLREEHERLNPLVLKQEIDRRLARVFDVCKRYGKPKLPGGLR
ncbi:MAG: hypothetical protein AAB691_02155 [Patescibacteria group bacterium]